MKTIALPEDTYCQLRELKFELKKDTMKDVVQALVIEHKKKHGVVA